MSVTKVNLNADSIALNRIAEFDVPFRSLGDYDFGKNEKFVIALSD